ncbi:MAG: threonine/serine exporter family protein [Planctomycetota bacterium]
MGEAISPTRNAQAASEQLSPPTENLEQDLLVVAATMLHRYGTPAYRLERVMTGLAQRLGIAADFLYTPTSLLVSFKQGLHRTRLERIEPSAPELGKLIELDSTLDEVAAKKIGCEDAMERLQQIDRSPSRYGFVAGLVASAIGCACATIFLGGGIPEAIFAASIGSLIQLWGAFLQRYHPQEHLHEITAGFFSAAAAIVVSQLLMKMGWTTLDQGTACLGSLIILVPGFTFTVSLAELANRHLSCGVARLAGAAVVFLALVCGVALAWRLGAPWRIPAAADGPALSAWIYFSAVVIAPFSFAILFQARVQDWPIIVSTAWIGFFTSMLATPWQGQEFGAFAGALALGAVANLYARIWDRPTTVAQMPGILMLVPGSLGYRSLTAFVDQNGIVGIESAFAMAIIAISIVGGLLASNLIVPPKRIL